MFSDQNSFQMTKVSLNAKKKKRITETFVIADNCASAEIVYAIDNTFFSSPSATKIQFIVLIFSNHFNYFKLKKNCICTFLQEP